MQHAFAHYTHPSQSSSASHFGDPSLRPHGLSAGPEVFCSALISLGAHFRHQIISATALSLAWLRKCIIWLLRRLRQEPDQHCVPISFKLKPSLLETPKMQKDKGRVCRRLSYKTQLALYEVKLETLERGNPWRSCLQPAAFKSHPILTWAHCCCCWLLVKHAPLCNPSPYPAGPQFTHWFAS